MTEDPQSVELKDRLLDAAVPHVPFDGWSLTTLRAAARDSGMAEGTARALFPRGGVDLALAFHRRGDAVLAERLAGADLADMRFRDRVAHAIRLRIEAVPDRELARRGTTLFALPIHAADGAVALWGTADAIWKALGDTSNDLNWYSKRATLSGVYASTVLFWLGDDSPGHQATWEFLDRRIEDVMRIEKAKAAVKDNPVVKAVSAGPRKILEWFGVPHSTEAPDDLPGRTTP